MVIENDMKQIQTKQKTTIIWMATYRYIEPTSLDPKMDDIDHSSMLVPLSSS